MKKVALLLAFFVWLVHTSNSFSQLNFTAYNVQQSSVGAGETATITFEISTGGFTSVDAEVQFYYTKGVDLSFENYLGKMNVTVDPGFGSGVVMYDATLPNTVTNGVHYIHGIITGEDETHDNIEILGKPDIIMNSTTYFFDDTVTFGDTVTMLAILRNNGTAATDKQGEFGIFYSTDQTLELAQDSLLTDSLINSPLLAASNKNFDPPFELYFTDTSKTKYGKGFLLFAIDYNDSIDEQNESNNLLIRTIYVFDPDLAIGTTGTDKTSYFPSEDIQLSANIENLSDVQPKLSWLKYYISEDGFLDAEDHLLDSTQIGSIGKQSSESDTITSNIPESFSASTYYILYVADGDKNLYEVDETNNISIDTITVKKPVIDVELYISNDTSTNDLFSNDDLVSLDVNIVNHSDLEINDIIVSYFYSDNGTRDGSNMLIDHDTISVLNEDDTAKIQKQLNFTLSEIPEGEDFYIFAEVDIDNILTEDVENNNLDTFFVEEVILHELNIASCNDSVDTLKTEETLDVKIIAQNDGNVIEDEVYSTYFWSLDRILDGNDIVVLEDTIKNLSIGLSSDIKRSVNIPDSSGLGDRFVLVYLDHEDSIKNELDETNNMCVVKLVVEANTITPPLYVPKDSETQLSVFPNPMIDQLHILIPEEGTYTLKVININGTLVKIVNDIEDAEFILERGGLTRGVFLVELIGENKSYKTTLIVQ